MSNTYLDQIQLGIKCTNSYWSSTQVMDKLENPLVIREHQSNALWFIEETTYDFWRLYFYIQDIIKIDWTIFEQKPLIAEIIIRNSKKEKWLSIIQEFERKGNFEILDIYDRYFKEQSPLEINDIDFSVLEKPKLEDFLSLRQLIELNFNPHTDKIPSEQELKELKETTFIIKDKEEIVGFFITEKKGVTLEFRYWLVLKAYRGRKYGSLLLSRVLSFDPEIKRTVSWIRRGNDNVVLAHKEMGFKQDGLTNYILHRK